MNITGIRGARFIHPAEAAVRRRRKLAQRHAMQEKVDARVAAGLASLVEAAVSKVKNPEPEVPSESTLKNPAPFGQNRRWDAKDFIYHIFDPEDRAKAHVSKVLSLKTGDRAPPAHLDLYWQCKSVYGKILRNIYGAAGVSPVSFSLYRLEDSTHVGYGRFTADFIADDPKYLANDLAHVGARLAARGLYFEFNYATDCGVDQESEALCFTPSVPASKVPARPFAGEPTLVSWREDYTGLYAHTMLRAGDWVAPELDGYFAQQRNTFVQVLDAYAGERPKQFVLYDGFRKADETEFFAAIGRPDGGFSLLTASKSASGHKRAYHACGYLPESFGPDELAHLACRFAAHGLIFGLVPAETDRVSPDVHALMWNAAA